MPYYFPEGSKLQFSSTIAAAKTISALTNANPAVATSTAHGYTTSDEILLTSGWEDASNTIYRVTVIDANSFSIQGLDATNTSTFSAGTGIGTAQKITGFTDIPGILSADTSGGGARFTEVRLLAARNAVKIPTGFDPVGTSVSIVQPAPANATWLSMIGLSRTATPVAVRQLISGGITTYGYGYMSVNESAKMQAGQVNSNALELTFLGRSLSY